MIVPGETDIMSRTAQVFLAPTPSLTTRLREQERAVPHSTQSPWYVLRGREIARELFPDIGDCERCGAPAVDRHHKDDDTWNNERSNLEFLCRRCHMQADGRMAEFESHSVSKRGPQPPNQCANCKRFVKPLRRGRCHACNEYLRRRGIERPYVDDGRKEKAARR